MTVGETTEGRRYGGAEADERRDRRRAALVRAGLTQFGTHGYANVSVKRICEEAGLTQRYFYESFADRPALLSAVYDHCVEVARAATLSAAAAFLDGAAVPADDIAAAAHATLGAFLGSLSADPHRARVMLVEVVGVAPAVESLRLRAIHGWADLVLALALGGRDPDPVQRLAAVGLIGAVTQLLVDWYFASVSPDPIDIGAAGPLELSTVLDVCVELFTATYDRVMRDR
ncbi:MAG: TetR/AcrR family transcriptional regulator [Gordonia sp. (in: high G+C Gram-positive bacteria)]